MRQYTSPKAILGPYGGLLPVRHNLNQWWLIVKWTLQTSECETRIIFSFKKLKFLLSSEKFAHFDRPSLYQHIVTEANGRRFLDGTFKRVFVHENVIISIENSLKFIPTGRIYKIPPLVQIMAWRRPGDKTLSEPMVASLLTHICVTRP